MTSLSATSRMRESALALDTSSLFRETFVFPSPDISAR
ncbi:hypothetical protein EVA_04992 [gut metagenome]|uniref:Uncharacterized protein n=1 Tax=gut metagenome TaxID=749906 RepID=J9H0Q0_9ZZZZ